MLDDDHNELVQSSSTTESQQMTTKHRDSIRYTISPTPHRASSIFTKASNGNNAEAEGPRELLIVGGIAVRQRRLHIKTWRMCATFYSFLILGAVDASYGVSRRRYKIDFPD